MEIALLSAFLAVSLAMAGYVVRRLDRCEERSQERYDALAQGFQERHDLLDRRSQERYDALDQRSQERYEKFEQRAEDRHDALRADLVALQAAVAGVGERLARIEGRIEGRAEAPVGA